MKLTKEILLEHVEYKDGDLFCKKLGYRNYTVKIGEKLGYPSSTGRLAFRFLGTFIQNHRAVFLMHHGFLPEIVDHIDGDFTNNKIENLREADKIKNGQNSKTPKSNTSGVKGVDFHGGKWRARIVVSGRSIYLGGFKEINDAEVAIKQAREAHHKDFARNA